VKLTGEVHNAAICTFNGQDCWVASVRPFTTSLPGGMGANVGEFDSKDEALAWLRTRLRHLDALPATVQMRLSPEERGTLQRAASSLPSEAISDKRAPIAPPLPRLERLALKAILTGRFGNAQQLTLASPEFNGGVLDRLAEAGLLVEQAPLFPGDDAARRFDVPATRLRAERVDLLDPEWTDALRAELANLWHLSRTALAGTELSPDHGHRRGTWTTIQFDKLHPEFGRKEIRRELERQHAWRYE
jgi:hypothetical protein